MLTSALVVLRLVLLQDAAAPAQPPEQAPAQSPAAAPPTEPAKPAAPATTFGELASLEAFEQALRQLANSTDGKVTLSSLGTSTAEARVVLRSGA